MSKKVAGEAERVTFSECIADGRVPAPDKTTFPKWQAWRRKEGRRPVRKRDGRGMRTDEEVALWKAIMVEYYGEEDSEEDDDEEDEESSAADVDELLKQLRQLFRPDQEDMGVLLARVTRLVMALKTLGHDVKTEDLDRVTLKAEIIQEAYDRVGTWDARALVRTLRDQFAFVALDPNLSDEDKTLKAEALGQVILGFGGKESSKSDKLFSTPSVEGPVLDSPTREAVSLKEVGRAGLAKRSTDGGNSPLHAKVAALEMELEALKRGSDGSVAGGEAQTKMLQETLMAKGGVTSVTSVKTDVNWPTLTDDRSEARDVAQFYEEFEDCCSLANNCKGVSFYEHLSGCGAGKS
ncbi:Pro-Pol polyprotein [Durusdinium trenchii]|uniref:Pro-Pol polyprotein n=1 Tax=Durusdinium trenchii TaxID=1381693 RepID=A0ABP0M273_9DINO